MSHFRLPERLGSFSLWIAPEIYPLAEAARAAGESHRALLRERVLQTLPGEPLDLSADEEFLSSATGLFRRFEELWEGLEQDLNYNAMVSQRGVLNLYHSDAQRDAYARRGNAMRMHGVDAELLDRDGVKALVPFLDFDNARFPIQGGLIQRRGGTARHDAVAWGYARGADQRGASRHAGRARGVRWPAGGPRRPRLRPHARRDRRQALIVSSPVPPRNPPLPEAR